MSTATLPPKAEPFLHLPALRAAHDQLQDRWEPDERQLIELVPATRQFIDRARATGRVLDADSDRFAAQRLITYWVNRLCREGLDPPAETILEEYVEGEKVYLDDSARPYLTLGEAEHTTTEIPGWGRLIRECLQRLSDNGLAAIIGHTGSGRRTLVTTGVLPRLREQVLPGDRRWRLIGPVTPGQKPLTELLRAIGLERDPEVEVSAVRTNPRRLGELLDTGDPAVVFVDQLEGLFSTTERADIEPYIQSLLALRNGKTHRVLLTIQSEALPQLAGFDDLSEVVDRGRVYLVFTTRELRQAIENPALRVGLRFDAGVVDRLITDVQGDPAVIPLLQFSLLQLWEHRTGDRITRETYDRLGGGRSALRRAADAAFQDLERAGHADLVRAVMMSMVRQELGRQPDCQWVSGADLRCLADRSAVEAVLSRLVKARLLDWRPAVSSAGNAADAGAAQPVFQDADQFTLVHSALIESWPTFQEWLEADRDRRRQWQVLRSAAEKWRDNNFDNQMLWGGAALEENYKNLDDLQKTFLDRSRQHQEYLIRMRKLRNWLRIAAASVIVVLVCTILVLLVVRAELQKSHEQQLRIEQTKLRIEQTIKTRRLGLQASLMSIDAGQSRDATGTTDSNDPAGAVLWYAEALRLFSEHSQNVDDEPEVIFPEDRMTLEENLRIRLGITSRRLPVVRSILTPPDANSTVFRMDRDGKSDPQWAATWNSTDSTNPRIVHVRNLRKLSEVSPMELPGPVSAAAFRTSGVLDILIAASGRPSDAGGGAAEAYVRVWIRDKDTGKWQMQVDQSLGVPGLVTQAELSPDGKRAAVILEQRTGKDRKHRVFRLSAPAGESGETWSMRELPLPDDAVVNRIALRPSEASTLAAALQNQTGNQGRLRIWDADGEFDDLYHVNRSPIRYLVYSADGKWLLSCGGADGTVTGSAEVWGDDTTGSGPGNRPPVKLGQVNHDAAVLYAAFNGSAERPADRFLSCGENGKVVVSSIDAPRGPGSARFGIDNKVLAHGSKVFGADFSPDGRHIVTGCRDQKARVWDVPSGELAFPALNHTGTVVWVGFDASGRHVCSTSGGAMRDGKDVQVGQVWELVENQTAWFVPTPGRVRFVGGDLSKGQLITVAAENQLTETRLWSAASPLKSAPSGSTAPFPGDRQVTFAAASPKGDRLVTISGRSALLWNVTDGGLVCPPLDDHQGSVNYACFDPAGKVLVTAAGDKGEQNGEVVFWDAGTGARKTVPECATDWAFLFAAVSPDGRWAIATGGPGLGNPEPVSNDKVWAVLWPLDASGNPGNPIKLQGHHTEPVTFAAFHPNGRYVVTAGTDNRACVWEVPMEGQLRLVNSLNKHTADIVQVAFGPDGRYLVTTGEDAKAIVWEAETGRAVMTLNHGSRINSTIFDSSGRFLVTSGQDGKARLWQVQAAHDGNDRAQPPSPLIAAFDHAGPVVAAAFADDNGSPRLRTVARLVRLPGTRTQGQESPQPPPGESSPIPPSDLRAGPVVSALPGFWVTEWDLRADSRTPDEIRRETEIVARRTLAGTSRELRLLHVEELRERWAASTGQAPANQPTDRAAREKMIANSDREARRATAADLRRTALWHLNRGIDLAESDPDGKALLPPGLLAELYARRAVDRTPAYFADEVGKWEEAIADYDRAIGAADRAPDAVRANLHATVAVARLTAARTQSTDLDALVARATEDFENARQLNLRDFRIEARLGDAFRDLARKAMEPVSQDYWERATEHYSRAIDQRAQLALPESSLFVRRSEAYMQLKKWDLVVDDCNLALTDRQPTWSSADLYRRRAEANEKKSKPDPKAAISDYLESARDSRIVSTAGWSPTESLSRALELARRHDPGRIAEVLKAQGVYLVRNHRWAEAVTPLRQAAESPALRQDWELWKELAEAYFATSALADATTAFERAINAAETTTPPIAKGQLSAIWQRLADVRFRAKEWDQADRAIEEAVRHANGDAEVVRIWLFKAHSYGAYNSVPGTEAIALKKVIDAYSRALEKESNEVRKTNILTERAQTHERAGLFKEMAADYDALVRRQPGRTDFRLARDRAWAELDRWAEARSDLKDYTRSMPADRRAWLPLAIAQLRLDDFSGYEDTCDRVMKQFGPMPMPADAYTVSWVLALADAPGQDWGKAVGLMNTALVQNKNNYFYLKTLGVLLYRAGKYDEARDRLDDSRKAYTGSLGLPQGFAKEDGSPTDQLFLAMTYHQLKKPEEAKAWLAKAVEWLDKFQPSKPGTGPTVWQRAEWELHRKEAEKLIGPLK